MKTVENELMVLEPPKDMSIVAEASKNTVTVLPQTERLLNLLSGLRYIEPDLTTVPALVDSFLKLLDNAYNFQKNSQLLTALIIGFCISNIDQLYERSGNREGVKKYRKLLKERYHLTNKQASTFKDLYSLFAKDYKVAKEFALQEQFEGYTASKLVELITVAKSHPEDLGKFDPRMTVKQIREKKKNLYGDSTTGSTNVDKPCDDYISPALFEQTICISSTDNINAETIEKCIKKFKDEHPSYSGNLKLMFYE